MGTACRAYAGLCFIYFDLDLPEAAKLVGAQAIKRAQEIATGKFEDEATVSDESTRNPRRPRERKTRRRKRTRTRRPRRLLRRERATRSR